MTRGMIRDRRAATVSGVGGSAPPPGRAESAYRYGPGGRHTGRTAARDRGRFSGLTEPAAATTLPRMSDPFRLQRFVDAQSAAGTYDRAVRELRAGRKKSHWMWFVFPQIAGLGHSGTSREFAISGPAEARAYLEHPVLGPRLLESARLLTCSGATSAEAVFGHLDAQKLQSSMTLFAHAAPPDEHAFQHVLDRFFDGAQDPGTTSRLP